MGGADTYSWLLHGDLAIVRGGELRGFGSIFLILGGWCLFTYRRNHEFDVIDFVH
jgi:hypothetical protein